jgi:hypothetical protein
MLIFHLLWANWRERTGGKRGIYERKRERKGEKGTNTKAAVAVCQLPTSPGSGPGEYFLWRVFKS